MSSFRHSRSQYIDWSLQFYQQTHHKTNNSLFFGRWCFPSFDPVFVYSCSNSLWILLCSERHLFYRFYNMIERNIICLKISNKCSWETKSFNRSRHSLPKLLTSRQWWRHYNETLPQKCRNSLKNIQTFHIF